MPKRSLISAAMTVFLALTLQTSMVATATAEQNTPPAIQPGFNGLNIMKGSPGYATTPLGPLHYWSLGEGPVIVLLHPGPTFSVVFAKVQPLLAAQGFRTIAVDIPGFGFSPRPDHAATAQEYADSLAALLDQLGIRKASFAGSHTGATLSLAFAAHHPERTECLIMEGIPVYSPEELAERVNTPPPDTQIYSDGRHIGAWWSKLPKRGLGNASPESLQWLMIGTLLTGDFDWYGEDTGKTFVTRSFDSAAAIKSVKSPTLIMSTVGSSLEPSNKKAIRIRPDFDFLEMKKQEGFPIFDSPNLFADPVAKFVRQRCRKG